MLELDPAKFRTIIMTVIFAMKHEKPEEMEIGLKSMWDLNDKISCNPYVCNIFYTSFYSEVIKETLSIMMDCRHLSGFKLQCKIMQQLINVVDKNQINNMIN